MTKVYQLVNQSLEPEISKIELYDAEGKERFFIFFFLFLFNQSKSPSN